MDNEDNEIKPYTWIPEDQIEFNNQNKAYTWLPLEQHELNNIENSNQHVLRNNNIIRRNYVNPNSKLYAWLPPELHELNNINENNITNNNSNTINNNNNNNNNNQHIKPYTWLPPEQHELTNINEYNNNNNNNNNNNSNNSTKYKYIIYPEEDSPIKLVRYTVSNKDNQKLPTLTIRVIVIGIILNIILCIINHYLFYLNFPYTINSLLILFLAYPLGKLMEWLLPNSTICNCKLNPGVFNFKELTLILIFCSNSINWPYSLLFISSLKHHFLKSIGYLDTLSFLFFTQSVGMAITLPFYKLIILNHDMLFPSTLISISFIKTLFLNNNNLKMKFFIKVFIFSFLLYLIPGYFIKLTSMLPMLCILFNQQNNNPLIQQIGSPLNGLGIGVITIDWTIITSSLGSPIITPFHISCNIIIGFVIFILILLPIGYYLNINHTKLYPIIGFDFYNFNGNIIDLNSVEQFKDFNISFITFIIYSCSFATLSSLISYLPLNHFNDFKKVLQPIIQPDIHAKLILNNYKPIPKMYYFILLIINILLIIYFVYFNNTVINLPWYASLISITLGFLFTFPNSILYALSNQLISNHFIMELIAGSLFVNNSIGNMYFKTLGFMINYQAISFLYYQKLAHYLKIAPKLTFVFYLLGIIVSSLCHSVIIFLLDHFYPNLCNDNNPLLNCINTKTFSNASILWGKIGFKKLLIDNSKYTSMLYFIPLGFVLPIFIYFLKFKIPILKFIIIPILFSAISLINPIYPFQFPIWFLTAFIFNFLLFRYKFNWWANYNLIFSAAMDLGVSIAGLLVLVLLANNLYINWKGNQLDLFC